MKPNAPDFQSRPLGAGESYMHRNEKHLLNKYRKKILDTPIVHGQGFREAKKLNDNGGESTDVESISITSGQSLSSTKASVRFKVDSSNEIESSTFPSSRVSRSNYSNIAPESSPISSAYQSTSSGWLSSVKAMFGNLSTSLKLSMGHASNLPTLTRSTTETARNYETSTGRASASIAYKTSNGSKCQRGEEIPHEQSQERVRSSLSSSPLFGTPIYKQSYDPELIHSECEDSLRTQENQIRVHTIVGIPCVLSLLYYYCFVIHLDIE